jgi:apolipoprotein N-acyltransferase
MRNGSYAARCASILACPALAAISAVLISLSLPPTDLHVLAWICLVPFFLAIRSCRTPVRSALCAVVFVLSFGSVFAQWLPGTVAVFFRLSAVTAWLSALAVYAAFGIVPIGLFAALAHVLIRQRSPWRILAGVPMLWVGAELFRVHLLGGLPWALLGHALYGKPTLIQVADFAGVFGVSFLIAAVNTGIFLAVIHHSEQGRRALVPLALAVGLVGTAWLYGNMRLAQASAQNSGEVVAVGLLQPNRAPVYRWTRVAADRALLTYLRLSQRHFAGEDLSLIVWPENAIPLYPERDGHLRVRLAQFAEKMGAPLILGAPGSPEDGAGSKAFNAAHMITPADGLVATYRKRRLVPFAEYSPVATAEAGDGPSSAFVAGEEAVVFTSGGIRWGPTICLDFVFADVVRASVRAGAEVLVNLSNDSWLVAGGQGAAEQQHTQAVFRAVENRRDVVRATTTGISAAVSATGIPQVVLGEGEVGGLIAHVTPRRDLTIYTRWGDLFAVACAALGVAIVAAIKPA